MKGVVIAAGKGTRLKPLTNAVNKPVLPVYDKPLLFYPVETLIDAGITDILIVSNLDDVKRYAALLEPEYPDVEFHYRVQTERNGIAGALALAEDFVESNVTVILGDNIIFDDIQHDVESFPETDAGAKVFLKEVENPSRFGVATKNGERVTRITEKPTAPQSNTAVTGVYIYDSGVFDIIREITPSGRGEYEITAVNNGYIDRDSLAYRELQGPWFDIGTPDHLLEAAQYIRTTQQ